MTTISDILFVISNGLLIPVILLLLLLLMKAAVTLAGLYVRYRCHRLITKSLIPILHDYSPGKMPDLYNSLAAYGGSVFSKTLKNIMDHSRDRAYCDHELANYQVEVQRILSKDRMLVKFGPMFGLMGTLIPMGPALVGLGTGDLTAMAYNMQVAFATTVVGMVIAAIGLLSLQINQRFYAKSLNDLEYLYRKMTEE